MSKNSATNQAAVTAATSNGVTPAAPAINSLFMSAFSASSAGTKQHRVDIKTPALFITQGRKETETGKYEISGYTVKLSYMPLSPTGRSNYMAVLWSPPITADNRSPLWRLWLLIPEPAAGGDSRFYHAVRTAKDANGRAINSLVKVQSGEIVSGFASQMFGDGPARQTALAVAFTNNDRKFLVDSHGDKVENKVFVPMSCFYSAANEKAAMEIFQSKAKMVDKTA